MSPNSDALAEFRRLVVQQARQSPTRWDDSRRLIQSSALPDTMAHLLRLSREKELSPQVKEQLRLAFRQDARRVQDLQSQALKLLTGYPPTKALRALCIYFDLIPTAASRWPISQMSSESVERFIRHAASPFDLLCEADVASVLEVGAGDLSFASELADQYGPLLHEREKELIVHCLDRLHPASKLGGPLHPEQTRLRHLQSVLGPTFRFYGNQDMMDLRMLDDQGGLASRYTIVTCWAPATPTFAYEPTRLSPSVIADDLRRTKGRYRQTKFDGEPALEVLQGGRALLFPAWKFEIHGPLLLLGLAARRGLLAVLGAVDSQVFWELLAQLLEDPRYRPADIPFTPHNLADIFGEVFRRLDRLALGESLDLADLASLRIRFPDPVSESPDHSASFSFRSIRIRRGATFKDVPAGSTARKFTSMVEETPPWFMTLVPA